MSRYESHNLEDRELPFIYRQRAVKPTDGQLNSSNWHENIELIYIVSGSGIVSVNGRAISVSAGDAVAINANQLHALAAYDQPLVHRYLIVDRSFCLSNSLDTSAFFFNTEIDDKEIKDLMNELHAAYEMQKDTPFRTITIRTLVLRIMVLLCAKHSSPISVRESPEKSASYVKQAITYIRASYEKDFSLDDVAAYVGVNKCYLSREFHKYTGYPFVSYVNLTRCKMAQQLLTDERLSVTEVGRRCGFANRSYFAKCFRRYIGVLPAEYRNNTAERI